MAFRRLHLPFASVIGCVAALACGGPNDTDFGNDDGSAGEPSGGGGSAQGGSSQGGSAEGGSTQGGSAQGGSSGSGGGSQGGTESGGSSSGGTENGGASGTETGGGTTGGSGGTDPVGGSGGELGGTGPGGSGGTSAGGGSGGQGGSDCQTTIASAQAALLAAQACLPGIDAPSCRGTVKDLCDCTVPVDNPDSTATKNYLALREAAMKCHPACVAVVCPEPTTATCGFGGAAARIVAQARCTWSAR